MSLSLWQSWSHYGRIRASTILNIPIQGIIPTTNHLEAFNCLLKRKHIHRWQRAGKRLRVDLLVFLLVTQILPGIFHHRKIQDEYNYWLQTCFLSEAGGVDLLTKRSVSSTVDKNATSSNTIPLAWWSSENQEQYLKISTDISMQGLLGGVHWLNNHTVEPTCASTKEDIRKPNHIRYSLWINIYGVGYCSCPGFLSGDGACKHLWALRTHMPRLIASKALHQGYFCFHYPQTKTEALKIHMDMYKSTINAEESKPPFEESVEIQSFNKSTTYLGQLATHIDSWLLTTSEEDRSSALDLQEGEFNSEDDSPPSIRLHQVCDVLIVLCRYTHSLIGGYSSKYT